MATRDINPLHVRFPEELREIIENSAQANRRSKNSEILVALERYYARRSALEDFTDGELIDELIRRWGREAVKLTIEKNNG